MSDFEMELEHEILEKLVLERHTLMKRLNEVNVLIKKYSNYWVVGKDGLVDLGLGVFHDE